MNTDPLHRAKFRQLWIDRVRTGLEEAADFERTAKMQALNHMTGSTAAGFQRICMLPPELLAVKFMRHGLADPLPSVALRTLKAHGLPERELTIDDWSACEPHVSGALNWCAFNILRSSRTQIMLLDDRTAKAVADSDNEPITAAELQALPHNPCLIEFYRPIEIAETLKRGIRLRAVGFESIGDPEFPVAVVGFYLDSWEPVYSQGKRWPATFGIWFGGFTVVTIDRVARTQIGIAEPGSAIEEAFTEKCLRVARNLWDFITMRSVNYDRIKRVKRKPGKSPPLAATKRPQHTPGLQTQFGREILHIYLSHEIKGVKKQDCPPRSPGLGSRVEVPGRFCQFAERVSIRL